VILWDDPDQDQWSKITRIIVHQKKGRILVQSGFIGFFDVPWSEWSQAGSFRSNLNPDSWDSWSERFFGKRSENSTSVHADLLVSRYFLSILRDKTFDRGKENSGDYSVPYILYLLIFLSQMREIDRNFRKRSGDFPRFLTISGRLTNATENVQRCSDDWTLPKLFEAFPMAFERIETRHFSTFGFSLDSKSTLSAVYWNIFWGICC